MFSNVTHKFSNEKPTLAILVSNVVTFASSADVSATKKNKRTYFYSCDIFFLLLVIMCDCRKLTLHVLVLDSNAATVNVKDEIVLDKESSLFLCSSNTFC